MTSMTQTMHNFTFGGSGAYSASAYAGGWEVERVQMPGDGWRDAHDYIASTVFDLVSLAGITGTMEPRGIFSMAVPVCCAQDGAAPNHLSICHRPARPFRRAP
jgi:hypothetical protein